MSKSEQQLLVILRLCQAKNVLLEKDESLVVEAKFKGELLSSDPISGSVNPLINTELAWAVTRKELQELRLQKAPIKVELFGVSANGKRPFGYCVLDPRTADFERVEQKWYKVVGSRRSSEPILLLVCLTLEVDEETKLVTAEPDNRPNEDVEVALDSAHGNLPAKLKPILIDGEYFQIGPEEKCTDYFTFAVTVVFADNLPLLLPDGATNWPHLDSKYFFYFSLLGCDITTEPFQNISYPEFLAEKATAKVRSSIDMLKQFFEEQKVFEIQFCCDDLSIGFARVDTSALTAKLSNEIYLRPASVSGQFPLMSSKTSEIPKNTLGQNPIVGLSLTLSVQQELPPSDETEPKGDDKKTQANESVNEHKEKESDEPKPSTDERLMSHEPSSVHALPQTNRALQERPLFVSPVSKIKPKRNPVQPADDNVPLDFVLSFMKELDDWKENQKQKFKSDSLAEEMRRLDLLLNQWRQQYSLWESAFKQRMEKCAEIEGTAKELLSKLLRRESDLKKVEEEFEKSKRELAWMSEKVHSEADYKCERLKGEFEQKLTLEQEKVKILQNEIKHLRSKESDNPMVLELQTKVAKLTSEKELLEDKLNHVRQSKVYYKEQWLRAVDKIESPFCRGEKGDLHLLLKQKDSEIEHLKSLLFSSGSRRSTDDTKTSSSGKNDSPLINAAIDRGMRGIRASADFDIRTVRANTEMDIRMSRRGAADARGNERGQRTRSTRSRSLDAKKRPLTNSEKTIRPPSATRKPVSSQHSLSVKKPVISASSLSHMEKELEMLENNRKSMLLSGLYKETDTVIVRTDAKIANLKQALHSD